MFFRLFALLSVLRILSDTPGEKGLSSRYDLIGDLFGNGFLQRAFALHCETNPGTCVPCFTMHRLAMPLHHIAKLISASALRSSAGAIPRITWPYFTLRRRCSTAAAPYFPLTMPARNSANLYFTGPIFTLRCLAIASPLPRAATRYHCLALTPLLCDASPGDAVASHNLAALNSRCWTACHYT